MQILRTKAEGRVRILPKLRWARGAAGAAGAAGAVHILVSDIQGKGLRRNPPVFPYNEMSEVYGAFYHYLAEQAGKKLPGKRVSALAYKNYMSAPEKIAKFPDNFTIVVCAGTPDFIRNKAHRAFIEEIYGGWQKKITKSEAKRS